MSGQETYPIRIQQRREILAGGSSSEGKLIRVSLPCEPWNMPDQNRQVQERKRIYKARGSDMGKCGDCGIPLARGNASGYCGRHVQAHTTRKPKNA